nr:uncharacterized protein LOC102455106 [Pelodiscus sinensis]|eukprot:XP_006135741.1 uncharacterized protein LOC102455106 [Pelodiscus sinensis]
MKAREQWSSSGAAPVHCAYYSKLDRILGGREPMSAPVLVQTGLPTPVQQRWQEVPQEDVEEEEEEQTQETVTLILQPVLDTEEALQPSSDPGEGTSARPAAADRRATPVPPPTQSHSTRRHWRAYSDLLRRHVDAMEKMEGTMAKIQETMAERACWHDHLLTEYLLQWSAMSSPTGDSSCPSSPYPPFPSLSLWSPNSSPRTSGCTDTRRWQSLSAQAISPGPLSCLPFLLHPSRLTSPLPPQLKLRVKVQHKVYFVTVV